MALIHDFFEIVSLRQSEGKLCCDTRFHPEHVIFQVHFPNKPVTPGTCLLQMVTEILESHLQTTLSLQKATSLKFKRVLTPNDEPTFVFTKLLQEENQVAATVSVEVEDFQCVKMSVSYLTDNKQ